MLRNDAHPLFRVQVPREDRFRWVQSARVHGHMHCRHSELPEAKKTDDHQCAQRTLRLNCNEIPIEMCATRGSDYN